MVNKSKGDASIGLWITKQITCIFKIKNEEIMRGISTKIFVNANSAFICENNIFLRKIREHNQLYFAGLKIGEINKKFKAALPLLWIIKDYAKNKVWVNEKAEQLFLYGRDIFASSIIKIEQKLRRGDLAIILNKLDEPLGLGKMLVDAKYILLGGINEDFVAVKNLMDMGWYIRKEKEI